jgi:hypothetical protein
MKGYWN